MKFLLFLTCFLVATVLQVYSSPPFEKVTDVMVEALNKNFNYPGEFSIVHPRNKPNDPIREVTVNVTNLKWVKDFDFIERSNDHARIHIYINASNIFVDGKVRGQEGRSNIYSGYIHSYLNDTMVMMGEVDYYFFKNEIKFTHVFLSDWRLGWKNQIIWSDCPGIESEYCRRCEFELVYMMKQNLLIQLVKRAVNVLENHKGEIETALAY